MQYKTTGRTYMEVVIRLVLSVILNTVGEKAAKAANKRIRRWKRKWVKKILPVLKIAFIITAAAVLGLFLFLY